jgi:hypothetical protein
MSTIGPALPPASITPTYSPLGKPAVGLENSEAKNQTLPPVEQSTRLDKNRSQPESDPDLTTDADRHKGQREREAASGGHVEEGEHEPAATEREAAPAVAGGSPAFRFITGAASAGAEKPAGGADAANAFKMTEAIEPGSVPGSLLDQRI